MREKLDSLVETFQKMPGVRKGTLYNSRNTILKIKHFAGTRMISGFPSMYTQTLDII